MKCGEAVKIGDYVKSEFGEISKIIEIEKYDKHTTIYHTDKDLLVKEEITKTSPNLIDLIQRNDFINGWQIAEINNVLFVMTTDGYITLKNYMKERKIKEVLTKEQYEREVYRV